MMQKQRSPWRLPMAVERRIEELGADREKILAAVADYLTGSTLAKIRTLAAKHAEITREIDVVQHATEEALVLLAKSRVTYAKAREAYLCSRAEAAAMAAQSPAAKGQRC